MRRIALTVTALLVGGLVSAAAIAPAPAQPGESAKPKPTCAGEKATIVDPSKGNDRIVGTNKRDVIVAGRGKGKDVVLGLDGDDLICGNARTKVYGGRGDDVIVGAGRADGGRGADRFYGVLKARGNKGADAAWVPMTDASFDGGAGHDRVSFYYGYVAGMTSGVYVNLATGIATADSDTSPLRIRTRLAAVEEVRGTPDDDLILGDGYDNVLRGGAGNDVLQGRGGYDTVLGGRGKDSCSGEVKKGCE